MAKPQWTVVHTRTQRKYGPPPDWTGPPPSKSAEVYYGNVPSSVSEKDLLPLFENVGKVYEFQLMMKSKSSHRSFGFVTYSDKADAERAVNVLNNFEIESNQRLVVQKSLDASKLYIGGIPTSKTKKEIFDEIFKYTENIVDVIMQDRELCENRGFVFVKYESHQAAVVAKQILLQGNIKLFNRNFTVQWADPEYECDTESKKEFAYLAL